MWVAPGPPADRVAWLFLRACKKVRWNRAGEAAVTEEGILNFGLVRRLLASWVSACLLLVAGCGGGGGGGGGDGGFRVVLNRSSVQFSFERGQSPMPVGMRATWTGQPPNSVYIGAVVEGQGIDPAIPVTLTNTHADITLRPRADLPVGQYTGRVLAFVCADPACTQPVGGTPIPIAYTVTVAQGLELTPASVALSAVENTVAPAQSLALTMPSASTTEPVVTTQYAAGSATGWLSVSRTATGYNLTGTAAALPQGVYTASVTFTPAAPHSSVTVPVTFTVGHGLVAPATALHTANAESSAASLTGTAPVNLAAGPALGWTATSNAAWLQLTTASGTTGGSLAYTIDPAGLQGLANFADHTAEVTITSSLAHVTPVTFAVTVRKRLPEVTGLGPYLLVSGRTSRVVVRGRGFSAVANVAGRLQASGLAVSNVTRISDTELTLDAAPAAATDARLSFSNALGIDGGGSTLRVVAPQAFAYAAIPSAGAKRAIVFDAQRRAVYAVNVDLNRLDRFRFDGSAWTADNLPVPEILDAGLAPDGQSLVVTATPGTLRLLDPGTLASQFTLAHPGGFVRNLTYVSPGIVTTNNGRSWLPTGNGGWNSFSYFDHATRTIQPSQLAVSGNTSYYGGPWAFASRDGERMLVVQSASISPAPPMLVLDARDSLLRVNTAGMTFTYDAPMSDDGSRVLFDWRDLRDGNLNHLGSISLTGSGYGALASALSPDGRRAYLLAYPDAAIMGYPTVLLPRVYVFDTTSITGDTVASLGHFDLAHYPTCTSQAYECSKRARTAISPDGSTLFFIGDAHLVVAPIPSGMQSAQAVPPSRSGMLRWNIGGR